MGHSVEPKSLETPHIWSLSGSIETIEGAIAIGAFHNQNHEEKSRFATEHQLR
jgi:hypothetical protein